MWIAKMYPNWNGYNNRKCQLEWYTSLDDNTTTTATSSSTMTMAMMPRLYGANLWIVSDAFHFHTQHSRYFSFFHPAAWPVHTHIHIRSSPHKVLYGADVHVVNHISCWCCHTIVIGKFKCERMVTDQHLWRFVAVSRNSATTIFLYRCSMNWEKSIN